MNKFKTVLAFLLAIMSFTISYSAAAPPTPPLDDLDSDLEIGVEEKAPEAQKPLPPINMILIKGGCFEMGDFTGNGDEDERPAHEVCVADFTISETEVTYELFEAVTGIDTKKDPKLPVTRINWYEINEFLKKLNKLTKGFYRIPTEAEWEYAAREGGKKIRWPGIDNEAELGNYAWFSDNSDETLKQVKLKKPNALGLYDMGGNVWEWVEDNFDFDYYQTSPKKDPYGPDFSYFRSIRGGSFVEEPGKLRTTYRYGLEPAKRLGNVGFRLAE